MKPKYNISKSAIALIIVANLVGQSLSASEKEWDKAGKNETLLNGEERAKAVKDLNDVFDSKKKIRAKLKVTVEDELLGPRVDEGDFALLRPNHLLRKFKKPQKALSLAGSQIREYRASKKSVAVKDFTKAPKKLKLLRAAMVFNLNVLEEKFSLKIYETKKSENAPREFRILLYDRPGKTPEGKKGKKKKGLLPYRMVQAKWKEGDPYFYEITFLPKSGDKIVETYTSFSEDDSMSEKEFEITGDNGSKQKTEHIVDDD